MAAGRRADQEKSNAAAEAASALGRCGGERVLSGPRRRGARRPALPPCHPEEAPDPADLGAGSDSSQAALAAA
eukprot:11683372-Alexandrium_andersonii.AAC.1